MEEKYYSYGDIVFLREKWKGRIMSGRPVRIVEDSPEMLVQFMAPGSRCKIPRKPNGEPISAVTLVDDKWRLEDVTWEGLGTLMMTIPGSIYSVWIFWEEDYRGVRCWYINLEEPIHRVNGGFELKDMVLDIILFADMTWRWKDEEDFDDLVRFGVINEEKAKEFRAKGEEVVALLKTGASPYHRWKDWTPPENWRRIPLPAGWDIIRPGF